jgi:pimeloyl-ACP methyl ester carboxylesterase
MTRSKVGIIFLHGYPLDSRMWAAQVEVFRDAFLVFAPDFSDYQWQTLADLSDALSIEIQRMKLAATGDFPDQWIVCGLSMGGYVALELWRRHPELVAALVLTNTKASSDDETAKMNRRAVIERTIAEGSEWISASMMPKLLSKLTLTSEVNLVERLLEIMREIPADLVCRSQRAMMDRHDFTEELHQIGIPTLIIAGEEDSITPESVMASMASSVPQSSFKAIPGSGHLSPMENPTDWNQVFRSFASFLERPENS